MNRHRSAVTGRALALKRFMDVILASFLLVLFFPVMLLVGLVIFMSMGTPVIFRQVRLGFEGAEFQLLKFRTMTDRRDKKGELLPDEHRLTKTGRFLRSLSLDELPELVNVLRGEMSIVGPRPLLLEYRELYSPEQWRRHEVRPGIAGPVVAKGRNSLDWNEKLALDVWYVDHWSLWLDVRLLAATIWKALKREGISAAGHVSMPRFQGTQATDRSSEDV